MDTKDKFTLKAENYAKYRPSYPIAFINYLLYEVGLLDSVIADIGAGTGILTKLLADKVKKIFAIEPNPSMQKACVDHCMNLDNVIIFDGFAEETGLPGNSVDFITAAQAFHWFDKEKCKVEFKRILKDNGQLILVWNNRIIDDALVRENETLLKRFCPDFKGFAGGTETSPDSENDIFLNGQCEYRVFDNDRIVTWEEFIGGSLSASYAPNKEDSCYKHFVNGLQIIFKKYSHNEILQIPNKTYSYVGRM